MSFKNSINADVVSTTVEKVLLGIGIDVHDKVEERLAEDYLNCGQPALDRASREWARRRGFSVSKGSGSGRARWGSDR